MYLKIQDLFEINRISLKFIRLKLLLILQFLDYLEADALLDQINKQKLKFLKIFFKSAKSPASGKENVRFPDSPEFEKFRTSGPDLMSSRALQERLLYCT